jgi:hypothetical protein
LKAAKKKEDLEELTKGVDFFKDRLGLGFQRVGGMKKRKRKTVFFSPLSPTATPPYVFLISHFPSISSYITFCSPFFVL